MTVPTISTLPPAPQRTQTPEAFATTADTFVASLATLVSETNTTVGAINNALAGALVTFNAYQGDWSAGTYASGDVVRNDGVFYISLTGSNTQEPPGTNWQALNIASSIDYDNSTSGLTATDVQDAIDEIAAAIGAFTWDSNTSSPAASVARTVPQALLDRIYNQIKGCVLNSDGSVNYYLNPTDWTLKAGGGASTLTGADGNVMVEIPAFYYRVTRSGTEITWEISDRKQPGFILHPAFIKDGMEVPKRYYGAYDACYLDDTDSTYKSGLNLDDMTSNLDLSNDLLASVKGVYPLVGVTRAECRSLASNNGLGWRQLDFTLWSAVQMLYLVEYQTFFSQDELGDGNTNGSYVGSSSNQSDSPHTIAGAGDSWANGSTDDSQPSAGATPGTAYMKYRGIENFYGNCWNWADGILVNDVATGNVYIGNDVSDWSDSDGTGMDLVTGSFPTVDGYIRNLLPADPYFLSSSNSGGGSTTYMTDQHFASASSDRVVLVGGTAFNGALAGVFCLLSSTDSSSALRIIGARLAR